jgi:hypothetical protein
MKTTLKQVFAWFLLLAGLLVMVFSNRIVFPGLERLLGIETIVGRENVVYQPDGGYIFTNPAAMMRWVLSVVIVGLSICSIGIWVLIRLRKGRKTSN